MFIYIISIIVLVLVIVFVLAVIQSKKYGTRAGEELVGMCNVTFERSEKRQENLDKIMTLFQNNNNELTNTKIRETLNVSSRTVVRYMDELEKENKVVQTGKIGYTVAYKLK